MQSTDHLKTEVKSPSETSYCRLKNTFRWIKFKRVMIHIVPHHGQKHFKLRKTDPNFDPRQKIQIESGGDTVGRASQAGILVPNYPSSVWVPIYLSYIYLSISVCLPIYLLVSIYLCLSLSIYLFIYLISPIFVSIYACLLIFIYLSFSYLPSCPHLHIIMYL